MSVNMKFICLFYILEVVNPTIYIPSGVLQSIIPEKSKI
jgi:hypothetical protein